MNFRNKYPNQYEIKLFLLIHVRYAEICAGWHHISMCCFLISWYFIIFLLSLTRFWVCIYFNRNSWKYLSPPRSFRLPIFQKWVCIIFINSRNKLPLLLEKRMLYSHTKEINTVTFIPNKQISDLFKYPEHNLYNSELATINSNYKHPFRISPTQLPTVSFQILEFESYSAFCSWIIRLFPVYSP